MKPNRQLSARKQREAETALARAFVALDSAAEARAFLEDLCTPAELQALADRWQVVQLLQTGLPYRRIYEKTGVSVTTIGRVARCLAAGSGGYRAALRELAGE
jgi:TrpR-related protein YerC/YecD